MLGVINLSTFFNKFVKDLVIRTSKTFRHKRFELFQEFINHISHPQILDVGGTVEFWEQIGFAQKKNIHITLLNLSFAKNLYSNMDCIRGDARNMSCFANNQFDVTFSNSVIEHVGTYEDQRCMAREIQRVGRAYFLQTPNYYFPFEPHYLTLGFQFLPISVKVALLRHFRFVRHGPIRERTKAIKEAKRIRLLRKRELKKLFPDGKIVEEKFWGITKSFICYGGNFSHIGK